MNDKNLELIPDKDGFLFEIKDNIEITQHIMVLLVSFVGLIAIWVFGIGEGLELSKGDIYNRTSGTILIVSSIYSIYKILKHAKEPHKILFYEHKIMKISSSKEKSISTINEIYKRPIIIDFKGKVKRVSISIQNVNGVVLARIDGNNVKDINGKILIAVDDIKKYFKNSIEKSYLVAFWVAIIKN